MKLGENLFQARKRKGLSQEAVAEKLGVSRQTISKWETDETLPDIRQAKKLAVLYGLTLDELIEFDADVQEIQEVINKTTQETVDKITGRRCGQKNIRFSPGIRMRWMWHIMRKNCRSCWHICRKCIIIMSWTLFWC